MNNYMFVRVLHHTEFPHNFEVIFKLPSSILKLNVNKEAYSGGCYTQNKNIQHQNSRISKYMVAAVALALYI